MKLYAVFGRESSIKEAADAAISAGHAILDELDILNKSYLNIYLPKEFEVGIGIHSGKVIVGEFNLGRQLKTSVMGLAVNIASRIQNSTKDLNNSFIASEEVMKHSSFNGGSENREVNLKGISTRYKLHLLGKHYKKTKMVIPGS